MLALSGDEEKLKEELKKHFIDEQMYLLLKEVKADARPDFVKEQFERFIQQREKNIKNRIREIVGITPQHNNLQDIDTILANIQENKTTEFKSTLRRNIYQDKDG